MDNHERKHLPRLHGAHYRGRAYVHWILTTRNRATGWLNEKFFLHFQLIATHTFSRYSIAAPCICLMPDHIHFLLNGLDEIRSDQKLAIAFLRKHLKPQLAPVEFQRQAYDHVLREKERHRGEFMNQAAYIRQNPERANLATPWPYECAIVPGYPDIEIRAENFWGTFWSIHEKVSK